MSMAPRKQLFRTLNLHDRLIRGSFLGAIKLSGAMVSQSICAQQIFASSEPPQADSDDQRPMVGEQESAILKSIRP